MALRTWPSQALCGVLIGLALFPFRRRFIELGNWTDGRAFGAIVLVIGYVAASGGMVERFVRLNEYPLKFAAITFIEILIQVAVTGPWTVAWIGRPEPAKLPAITSIRCSRVHFSH